VPVIAMGHLFVIGGTTSESEQTIYVGNLGDIRAGDFPDTFDYVALGHLHRYQKTGGTENIRYSGSPYMLSFSESGYDKKVVIIETEDNQLKKIGEHGIPKFREILKVRGSIEDCIAQLKLIDLETHELTPWVEVILDDEPNTRLGFSEINKAAAYLKLEVLKVSLKNERKMAGLEQQLKDTRHIKELSPLEVFKLKCKEQEFELDERPEILDAFNEVFQKVKESA
jgi:exonuclease SbcD